MNKIDLATIHDWWWAFEEKREPDLELPGYLKRWVLRADEMRSPYLPTDERSFYLHHITAADKHVHHCHPRRFRALILEGYYIEDRVIVERDDAGNAIRFNDRRQTMFGHGDTNLIPPGSSGVAHFISEVGPKSCWTIVEVGPKIHHWGFYLQHDDGRIEFVSHKKARTHSRILEGEPEPIYGPNYLDTDRTSP